MHRIITLLSIASTALVSIAGATAFDGPQQVPNPLPQTDYDAIVIGGGPAGLSAQSGLVRVRRHVLLIDSGEYRNADTRRLHDVIALDGITPAALRYDARQIISSRYPTAHMMNGTVVSIRPNNITSLSSFEVTTLDKKKYTARKIVLATGLKDLLPSTPGIKEAWARGIYWCPWCDGFEHADQRLGILGSLVDVPSTVLEIHNLNTDIIAFLDGTDTPASRSILDAQNPGWRQQLEGYGVLLDNRTIKSITRDQDGAIHNDPITGAEYDRFLVTVVNPPDSGVGPDETIDRDAFLTNFPKEQRSYLGRDLGVQYVDDRLEVVPSSMRTNVPGVWAIGDANSDAVTNVPHAMYTGKKAAVYAHVELEKEYAATLVTKRDVVDERDVEELMGRDIEDLWDWYLKAYEAFAEDDD